MRPRNPFRRTVHVKPELRWRSITPDGVKTVHNPTGWIVLEQNAWENFWDDRRRYGWRVAAYNFWKLISQ